MNTLSKALFAISILFAPFCSEAQNSDSTDVGVPDSLVLVPELLTTDSSAKAVVKVNLYYFSDTLPTSALSVGMSWIESVFLLDSVAVDSSAKEAFDFGVHVYRSLDLDTTNFYRQFLFFGVRKFSSGLAPLNTRRLLATYFFSSKTWSPISSLTILRKVFSAGSIMKAVTIDSRSGIRHGFAPVWGGDLRVLDPHAPCCVGEMGNLNADESIDIADLTLLINHLFGDDAQLACRESANVDGSRDGSIDIGDLIAFSEFLFNQGSMSECQ